MNFSDRYIKSLKPSDKKYDRNEGGGFTITVLPSGTKTFYIRYTFSGKQKVHSLGKYISKSQDDTTLTPGYLTLAEAKVAYNDCIELLKRGLDPATYKQSALPSPLPVVEFLPISTTEDTNTVQWLVNKYIDWSDTYHAKAWSYNNKLTLNKYVIPEWGNRRFDSIKKRDAIDLLDKIAKVGAGAARNAQRVIRDLFSYAVSQDYLDVTPIQKLTKAIPVLKNVDRKRVLSESEIRQVWHQMTSGFEKDPVFRAARLILVTAQRPEECAGLIASEIEDDWWIVPPERNKMKRLHRVYLTETAKEIIGDGEAKFKTRWEEGPITRSSISKKIVKAKYFGLPRWTPHDLRRTARTHMAKIGVLNEHAEAVVNHSKEGMNAVYNLYEYDKEKKDALMKWEAELLRIISIK